MAGQITRPSGAALMEKRIGASIVRSGWHTGMRLNRAKWSWPLGKVALYRDRLEIKAPLFRPMVLDLDEIENIRRFLWRVRIEHTNRDVPDFVALFGFGLLSSLREAVRRNRLTVRVSG